MQVVQKGSNKRAAKRYTYLPQARLHSLNIQQPVQIRDISTSGIQFFSNNYIQSNAPIRITWQDQHVGMLEPFLLTIRKVDQANKGLFRYVYGSKFINLKHETKSNIEKLVTLTKLEEKENNKKFTESISVELLLEIFKQSRAFLENLLKGNDDAKKFHRFIRETREYEKKSFQNSDEISQFIQKLATNNFQCNLLNVSIPFIPKNNAAGFELYKEAVNKIEWFSHMVIEAKKYFASEQIQESRNRLFYNNLELMQTFMETYESQTTSPKVQHKFQKIAGEYALTNPEQKLKK